MKKKILFILLISIVGGYGIANSAYFQPLVASSWYYGQRGAGISTTFDDQGVERYEEDSDFGTIPVQYDQNGSIASGDDSSELSLLNGGNLTVSHGLDVVLSDSKRFCSIDQFTELYGYYGGMDGNRQEFHISDNNFGNNPAYADSTVKQALKIVAEEGEAVGDLVQVTVRSQYFWSYDNESFKASINGLISGPFPHDFVIMKNNDILYEDKKELNEFSDSWGWFVSTYVFQAAIGDTIEVDSAIFSKIFLEDYERGGSWEGDASLNLITEIELESAPVPIPSAAFLLGPGLVAIFIKKRRKE